MTETLTESFCERCGTRYDFEAPARLNPLRRTRGFIGGLRNYLTSQDALSDAIGDAMRSEEAYLASVQLDAFHESFNFCIGCRQYTCVSCWNDDAGRCRTCVPMPQTDDLAEGQPPARGVADVALVSGPAEANVATTMIPPEVWPTVDLAIDPDPSADADTWVEPATRSGEPAPALELMPDPDLQPESQPELPPQPEPESLPVLAQAEVPLEPLPALALAEVAPPEPQIDAVEEKRELTPATFRVMAWEPDDAYELRVVEPDPPKADVLPAAVLEDAAPEPAPTPEPEPIAPAQAPTNTETGEGRRFSDPTPPISPSHETVVHLPPRPTSAPLSDERLVAQFGDQGRVAEPDNAPEVSARRAQLELLGLGDPGEGPLERDAPHGLPYRSRGTTASPAEMAAVAAVRVGGSFWEASAREVAAAPGQIGVQGCGKCGLSLSASARFCRRCGTRQAQSA